MALVVLLVGLDVKFSNCQKIQIQLNSRATFKKCDFINMIYAIACAYNSSILFYGYFNFSVHSCIYMSNCSITILNTYSPNLVDKFDYALKLTIKYKNFSQLNKTVFKQ